MALRLGGQLRAIPGAVLGWDMNAALAIGRALGVEALIIAEILPEIEAIAMRAINDQLKSESEPSNG